MKTKPMLFEYISVTGYLYDLMSYRKHESPGFTFESWAFELGFKSRSFMTMILNKERNITPHFIEVFSASMNFNVTEKSFFALLVQYSQSESETEKLHYLDRLLELQGKQKDFVEIKNYTAFLKSPLLPKLLVLLSFKDLDRTPAGLASFLNEDVGSITESLNELQKMGLAFSEATGPWNATKKSFKVPKNFGSEALANYHNHSLTEAIAAQNKPTDQRRFRSLLLPLSETDYQNLLTDIESLISKVVAKYDSETLDQKRLYKLNLNLFPTTEKYDEAQKAHNPENGTRLFESATSSDNETALS